MYKKDGIVYNWSRLKSHSPATWILYHTLLVLSVSCASCASIISGMLSHLLTLYDSAYMHDANFVSQDIIHISENFNATLNLSWIALWVFRLDEFLNSYFYRTIKPVWQLVLQVTKFIFQLKRLVQGQFLIFLIRSRFQMAVWSIEMLRQSLCVTLETRLPSLLSLLRSRHSPYLL